MSKDFDIDCKVLLKKHAELVSIYMHQNKIEWNLISVYIALNVGLFGAIATLFQVALEEKRMGAIVFLCILGFLFSLGGLKLFQRVSNQTLEWIEEGKVVEKALREKGMTVELFEKMKRFPEERLKIENGMLALAIVWLLVIIGTIVIAKGLVDLSWIFD